MTDTALLTADNVNNLQIRFLHWLYDDQAGYVEIVAGIPYRNKPDKIQLVISKNNPAENTRSWLYYDPERPDLVAAIVAYIDQLAAEFGNVYVGCRLYTREAKELNERSEERTLPSRVIFIDDAPARPDIPYSASVRTSEGSRHGYYKCDRHVTKDDNRRVTAALSGADASGVDLTQLVRVPGTFNTKDGQRWLVVAEPGKGPIYTLDQIRAAFPAVAPKAKAEITDLDWPEVETHLANIDTLLSCARSKLIKPETQTGRILGGEMLSFASSKLGRMDDSRTMNACAVAHGLLLRGYMDDEIAAVLYHLYEKWGSLGDRGTAWVKLDIGRCLAHAHAEHPDVKQTPTRYGKPAKAQPITDVLPRSRARTDRPQKFTPAALFAHYREDPTLCDQKRKARASALQVSTATLDRLEDALEALGLIEIEKKGRGYPGRVILLGGVINIPAAEVLSPPPIDAPAESTNAQAESGQNTIDSPQCIGETHPPPGAPQPPAPPALRSLVALALDDDGRAGLAKVHRYLADNGLAGRWPDHAVKEIYLQERDRRRYARQDAREAEKARKLKWNSLVRKSQAVASQAADMRRKGDKRAPIWERRAGILAAEETRRIESGEAPAERLKGKRAATVEEALILAEIAEQRRAKPASGVPGRRVSPPTPDQPPAPTLFDSIPDTPADAPVYDGWCTIARLKARLAGGSP